MEQVDSIPDELQRLSDAGDSAAVEHYRGFGSGIAAVQGLTPRSLRASGKHGQNLALDWAMRGL